jgi:hypothetical protein
MDALLKKRRRTCPEALPSLPASCVESVSGPWYALNTDEHAPDGVDGPEPPVGNSLASPAAVNLGNAPSESRSPNVDEVNINYTSYSLLKINF